jgi:hypothetical protein
LGFEAQPNPQGVIPLHYQLRDPNGLYPDGNPHPLIQNGVNVPSATWKIALILDANQGIQDISAQTRVISIVTPNLPYPPNLNTDINLPDNDPHNLTYWRNWRNFIKSVDFIENQTGLDFFKNLPSNIENILEAKIDDGLLSASLQADFDSEINSSPPSIFQGSAFNDGSLKTTNFDATIIPSIPFRIGQPGILKSNSITISPHKIDETQIRMGESNITYIGIPKIGICQDSISDTSKSPWSKTQSAATILPWVATDAWSFFEKDGLTSSVVSTEIDSSKIDLTKIGSIQVDPSQHSICEIDSMKIDSSKVTLPSSITLQQLLSSHLQTHNVTPILSNIYNTAQTLWHTTTPINLTFDITNLPTGQLAEGTITSYNTNGTPKTATITIDDDANGVGWFIDPTPQDNSEFTGVDNYLQATPNSPASGKYDLLTAILHEMGHTLGIINGYSQFNQNIKGRQFYTDPTHSYTLSSDLSHLDNTLYPNDLLNTNLKPGIRKLPSAMDWAIINTIAGTAGRGDGGTGGTVNPAHLTAGALIGITNGDFTTSTTWNTAGATNIINGTATLTEQSQKLSELTQAFIIPTGAKTLQFTIVDNHLIPGDTTKTANDAFEVALLDTNTFNPLAGTSIGLNHTDSLLNIQANGTIFHSDKVTITALGNNTSIVTIDLTQITPTTQATLYFNLLGFGARTSTITIDDVKLFTDTQPIPVTNNGKVHLTLGLLGFALLNPTYKIYVGYA